MAFSDQLSEFAFGKQPSIQQIPKYAPEQQQLMNQVGQQAFQGIQNNNLSYAPIADRLKKEYTTQTRPNLLAQFQSGNGNNNPFSGSALASILQGGEADLAERLAAGESSYNLNKQNTLLQQLGIGLKPQFESARVAGKEGYAPYLAASGLDRLLANLLSPSGDRKTESSTGQGQQDQDTGAWSYIKQALAWLARIGAPIGGAAVGGPAGAAAGAAVGNTIGDYFSPAQQASYQSATGKPIQQSPFAQPQQQRPLTLQEMRYQSLTGKSPLQAPFGGR